MTVLDIKKLIMFSFIVSAVIYIFKNYIKKKHAFIIFNLIFLATIFSQQVAALLAFVTLNYFISKAMRLCNLKTKIIATILYVLLICLLFINQKDFIILENVIRPLFFSYISLFCLSYYFEIVFKEYDNFEFIEYLNCALFFPNIMSGPIQNPRLLQKKINLSVATAGGVRTGIFLIINGIFKKTIADIANYSLLAMNLSTGNSVPIWLVGILVLSRTYADFSGYTDIAIGAGNILGVKLEENFNLPYLSNSVSEYWRRWHMTLGSWARINIFNTVYLWLIRLLKSKNINFNYGLEFFSITITFLVIGAWHGISWRFFIWSIINVFFVFFDSYKINKNKENIFQVGKTLFIIMVLQIIAHTELSFQQFMKYKNWMFSKELLPYYNTAAVLLAVGFLVLPHLSDWVIKFHCKNIYKKMILTTIQLMLISIINISAAPFIYGQF